MRMIMVFNGTEIAELRARLRMTPTEFAAALGVTASAVCYWEKDQRSPRIEIMQRINDLAKKADEARAEAEPRPAAGKRKAEPVGAK
jgi:DNA-binding transcriptional regulator YiaG